MPASPVAERVIYLDHAATTPMCDEAIEAMLPFFSETFGNPSGAYRLGRVARRALDDAREDLADVLGCKGDEVVFTSGGTEADNLAILGVRRDERPAVVVTAMEHKAVLEAAHGIDARVVPVDEGCIIDLAALAEFLDDSVALVSVMAVNNEVGTIQPIGPVVDAVREHAPQAIVHTDAVQAFPFLDIAACIERVDLATISAHKFAGPKGIGALVMRRDARPKMTPVHIGGGQERGLRGGTENVAGAVAMAAAARAWTKRRDEVVERVAALRDTFVDGLIAICPSVLETAPRSSRVVGNAHLRFPGLVAEELLMALDADGICASAGSACASGALEPSHVLSAMGLSVRQAKEAIRFSLGWTTTAQEIEHAVPGVAAAVARLG